MTKDKLYEWFKVNLMKIFESESVQQEIDKIIDAIHPDLQWEVGPTKDGGTFFAFSPNCDSELVELAEELAGNAPNIAGWEFLSAKPRKLWKKRKIEARFNDQTQTFFFDDWQYYLTGFNDGEYFDVNLVPPKSENRSKDMLEYIGDLFVEFEDYKASVSIKI